MTSRLFGYDISGNTIGVDIDTWYTTDLNGNDPFKVVIRTGDTAPSGYTDITSIENWNDHGFNVANDYGVARFAIKNIVLEGVWSGFTETEKDIAIKHHCAPTSMDAIIHQMTYHGMSQGEATVFVIKNWHKYYLQFIETCKQRWLYVMFIVPQYLSFEDAEDLFDTIDMLIGYYNNAARLGRNYGNANDGILDYVESTNGFVGQGLKETNYVLLQGTYDNLILAIKEILHDGIYTKYDDL